MQDTNLLPASARTTTDDQVLNVKEHELLLRQAWAIKQRCVTRNRSVSHSDWAEQGSDYEWSAFYDSTIDDIGIWRIRVKVRF
jgi:hypothetical protein